MIYDINALKAQGIPASALSDWGLVVTCADPRVHYQRMVTFYKTYGFDVFWAFKDQQMISRDGRTLSLEQKQQFVANMLRGFPE